MAKEGAFREIEPVGYILDAGVRTGQQPFGFNDDKHGNPLPGSFPGYAMDECGEIPRCQVLLLRIEGHIPVCSEFVVK